jgi:hypothetical protein
MLLHSSHVAVVARVVLLSHVLSYSSSFESWGGRGVVGLYLVDASLLNGQSTCLQC